MTKIRVTIWNEFRHEKSHKAVADMYPEGIHGQIAAFLGTNADIETRTAWLDQPENGLTDEVLANTDVLIWWGHMAHGDVLDSVVDRVQTAVLGGMGLICLHSAHFSKIFRRMMGTSCSLKWREVGERERLWVVNPGHPIAEGIGEYFEIPHVEMYGEFFDIPTPDELVLMSWFQGGEVFRSCCAWFRGKGKVVYFRPGHETLPIFYQPEVQKIITNAVRWAKPAAGGRMTMTAPNYPAIEKFTVDE
ncbi:MAG: trehalose utilization protein ThuA [Chloroflexi bacterium]|nr:trehalose utilization protein ThuA [Chloroflexota bacterium]